MSSSRFKEMPAPALMLEAVILEVILAPTFTAAGTGDISATGLGVGKYANPYPHSWFGTVPRAWAVPFSQSATSSLVY